MLWPDKIKSVLSSRTLQILARLVLGGIFIYASLDKIGHPLEFAKIINNYQILPGFLVTLPALVLPWLELLAGVLLIAGFWTRSAAWLLSSLLLAFILVLGVNAVRGIDVSCGCFSTSATDTENAFVLVFRDLLMLLPGLVIILFNRENKKS
jgi:putative oxidoreductase